jgi:hypothetical protein
MLAIDPGSSQSAFVWFDNDGSILDSGKVTNRSLLDELSAQGRLDRIPNGEQLAIEFPRVRGMAFQQQVLDTCLVAGRLIEAWNGPWARIDRAQVKLCLCNSTRATDANIRAALLDRYEPTGGGKTPQVGTKSQPGPLYGFKADMWAALAVGITFLERGESDFGVNSDREGLG